MWVGDLVGGGQPRARRAMSLKGFAQIASRPFALPITNRDVVDDQISRNMIERRFCGDVTTASADHHPELAFEVQLHGSGRCPDLLVGTSDATRLLVEPNLI